MPKTAAGANKPIGENRECHRHLVDQPDRLRSLGGGQRRRRSDIHRHCAPSAGRGLTAD